MRLLLKVNGNRSLTKLALRHVVPEGFSSIGSACRARMSHTKTGRARAAATSRCNNKSGSIRIAHAQAGDLVENALQCRPDFLIEVAVLNPPFMIERNSASFSASSSFAVGIECKVDNLVLRDFGAIKNAHNGADHILDVPHDGTSCGTLAFALLYGAWVPLRILGDSAARRNPAGTAEFPTQRLGCIS